tara:strand:+ start:783 stop:1034 length:252 start_codon:yes stop_codon:yes gene_type:complete
MAQDSDTVTAIIKSLKSAKHDLSNSQQTPRIQILEELSNEEKDKIILKLLDEANKDLRLEYNDRLNDESYIREVGARSFRDAP